jgi:hypothetical protein
MVLHRLALCKNHRARGPSKEAVRHGAEADRDDRRPKSSRGSRPPLPLPERSVPQEKHDDAQHRQGRHHCTPGDLHGLRVHRAPASRSLTPRLWLTASTLPHTAGGVAPAAPALGGPPVGQPTCAPPPVCGGGLGLAPRGRARHVPASAPQPSGAQPVAMAGTPQGEATCQGAHAQSWVKCPVLGTRLGHGAGGGRRPSSRPLTRRRDSPMSGHGASSTARCCQAVTGIAGQEPRVGRVAVRTRIPPRPPARRAPMACSPGHRLCSGGKLMGNQVPRGQEAALRC